MSKRSFDEVVDSYMNQENMHVMEGHRGVTNLCKLVRAIGYTDEMGFGQLTYDATIGDLIAFFEDNSGAIEAVIEWIKGARCVEWKENLEDVTIEGSYVEDDE